jgi:hypothetical protein
VPGVRDQSEAAGKDRADDLGDEDARRDDQDGGQPPAVVRRNGAMRVPVLRQIHQRNQLRWSLASV